MKALGIAMTIEDSWGGDVTTAAIAHLAHSTPEALRFSATDFNSYVTVSIAEGAAQRMQGLMAAPSAPGSWRASWITWYSMLPPPIVPLI